MKQLRNKLAALAAGGLALAMTAVPALAAKDSMTIAFVDKFHTMEPYQTSARQMLQMAYMIWDPLVLRDPDTGELQPHVATSWSNPEPTIWEFDIRDDIVFHSGNKLTAESVRYTIEGRILDPDVNSPRLPNFKWIKSVEVVDDDTFRIHTHEPYPIALQVLNTLYVMDEKWAAEHDFQYIQEHAMGSGPYQWVEWNKGSNVVLKKNPNYWMEGVPAIENVTIRIVPETATRLAELFAGSVDFAMNLQLDQLPSFEGRPNYEVLEGRIIRVDFWQFDSRERASESPVSDVRVRKAIAHAINKELIVERLVGRGGYRVNTPMSPYHFGVKEDAGWYEYDPEKAKQLLAEAGYPDGFEIDLWQYSDHQNLPNQAAMQMLAKVGIKVNLNDYRGNTQQMGKLRRAGQVTGIGNFNWGSYNIFDADAILVPFFDMESSNNYAGNEELSDILEKARFSVDPEFRMAQYAKAQDIIYEEVYWMPFFGLVRFYGKSVDLDIKAGLDEVPRFQFAKWKN
ncbi:MAG TPA: ABC transporter substrate-binding protein [Alphaproteobacteria bacterium]|nr:ABC transporter substrate-binding protein [Alphaproteobacteria bacterium]